MDKKQKRAEELGGWLTERQSKYRLDSMTEFEDRLRELNKLIVELRDAAWEREERKHASLQAEQTQVVAEVKDTKQVMAQKQAEQQIARNAGDPAAQQLAAEIEELAGHLQELAPRQKALSKELSGYETVGAFRGTLRELKAKALDPNFYLDRTWLAAMLIGTWFGLADDDQVSVRFPLNTGLPTAKTDYFPNEPGQRF